MYIIEIGLWLLVTNWLASNYTKRPLGWRNGVPVSAATAAWLNIGWSAAHMVAW